MAGFFEKQMNLLQLGGQGQRNNNLNNSGAGFILRPVSNGLVLLSSPLGERR